MNEQLKYSDWIERYQEGELDETAVMEFESELNKNSRLAFEYQLDEDLTDALKDTDVLDFRATLVDAQQEFKSNQAGKGVIRPITRRYWYAAASVIIMLIVAGSVFLLKPSGYSNEKLFSMYYDTGESIGISRTGGTNVVEALLQFQNNNFEQACLLFTELLENDPDNLAIQYYCGISNMEVEDYARSIELFSGILAEGNTIYHDNAEWYLGLSYLITNENDKAEQQFEKIAADDGHDFYEDAKSLLQKMAQNDKNNNFLNKILFFVLPF